MSIDDIAERKKKLELKIIEHENSPKKLINDSRSFRINQKSVKIALYKQRKILSEVFDILLATVIFAKHTAKENKLNNYKSQIIPNLSDTSKSVFPSNTINNGNGKGKKFYCQHLVNNLDEIFTENYQFPSDLNFILTEMEKNDNFPGTKKMKLIDYKLLKEKETKLLLSSSLSSTSTTHSMMSNKKIINNNKINNENLKLLNLEENLKKNKSRNYTDLENIEIPENGNLERGESSARSYGENNGFYKSNQNEQKSPLSSRNGDITITGKPFSSSAIYHRSKDYQKSSKSVFSSDLPQGNRGQNRENTDILSCGAYLLSFDRDGRNSLEFSKILELNGKREEGRKVKRILLNQNNYFSENEEEEEGEEEKEDNSNSEISDFCDNKSQHENENENENKNRIFHYHSQNKFQINNNNNNNKNNRDNSVNLNENENENENDFSSESSSRSASSYFLAPTSSQGCLDVFLAQPGG